MEPPKIRTPGAAGPPKVRPTRREAAERPKTTEERKGEGGEGEGGGVSAVLRPPFTRKNNRNRVTVDRKKAIAEIDPVCGLWARSNPGFDPGRPVWAIHCENEAGWCPHVTCDGHPVSIREKN